MNDKGQNDKREKQQVVVNNDNDKDGNWGEGNDETDGHWATYEQPQGWDPSSALCWLAPA